MDAKQIREKRIARNMKKRLGEALIVGPTGSSQVSVSSKRTVVGSSAGLLESEIPSTDEYLDAIESSAETNDAETAFEGFYEYMSGKIAEALESYVAQTDWIPEQSDIQAVFENFMELWPGFDRDSLPLS